MVAQDHEDTCHLSGDGLQSSYQHVNLAPLPLPCVSVVLLRLIQFINQGSYQSENDRVEDWQAPSFVQVPAVNTVGDTVDMSAVMDGARHVQVFHFILYLHISQSPGYMKPLTIQAIFILSYCKNIHTYTKNEYNFYTVFYLFSCLLVQQLNNEAPWHYMIDIVGLVDIFFYCTPIEVQHISRKLV